MRYTDDALILHCDKNQLEKRAGEIELFLRNKLDLELNAKKTFIRPVSDGIDYLGYIVRPFYILVRRRVVNNLKQKIYDGTLNRQSYVSYLGHFKHANTHRLKRHIRTMIIKQVSERRQHDRY
jgi:hypothetical protein